MKRYPAYKDSGVEWIDQIPNNWLIIPFRRVIEFLTDFEANGSFSSLSENVVDDFDNKFAWFVRATDLENKSYLTFQGCRYINQDSYQFLSKTKLFGEELLIAKRGEIGKIYQMPNLGIKASLAPNLYLLRLFKDKMSPSFAYYYFISDIGHSHLTASNKSTTIGALYKEDCKKLEIIYPPLFDQYNISDYLNHKTRQIDDLIDKKQKLIDLLKEERTAIIDHAVTKGLDPTVPMKDSGIEWLGEIPEHWFVDRLKYLVDNIIEKSNTSGFKVALENIESWTGRYLKTESPSELTGEMKSFKPNDVLFNKLRPYLAKVYLSEFEGECVGELLVLRPQANINPKFLYYRLLSHDFIEVVNSSTYGSKMPRASWEDFIRNLIIPYPDILEQEMIVENIEKMSVNIERTIIKLVHEIDLISEYKTSLINEAVTGKIKVSDAD